jgi:hypothetical protein
MQAKFLGYSLIALFTVWAVCAALGVMGQRKLFYEEFGEELYDYWMPRMCLEQGYVGHPEQYKGFVEARNGKQMVVDERDVVWSTWYTDGKETKFITGWRDKVYPAFALLPFKLFPPTRFGGYLWTSLAGVILLLSLCMIAKSWQPILLALSMPFIFNIERGNPVWISAACVGVFLAWWDDEREWKRLVAATCLAVAGTMKIAPFALGLVYFTKWRWRPVLFCGILSLVFMFVPWAFCRDGFAALPVMIKNASLHAQFVQRAGDIGLVELWRTFRIVAGQYVNEVWPGMKAVAILSQLIGVAVLVVGAKRRDYLLMVGGMLWAAGNMYYYAMLYLLPVLVIELSTHKTSLRTLRLSASALKDPETLSLLLWLALLSPLQVVVLGHSANQVIGNVALMGLMAIHLAFGGNCLAATTFAEATVVKKNAKAARIVNHGIH